MHGGQHRLRYLDGLRGVAILLVVAWHYAGATYTRYLPYGARYADLAVIRDGWMGVEIFFLISGFVIFMTIERCSGMADFLLRRWLRLFPAMLVASAVILAADRGLHLDGPYSGAPLMNVAPGLLLVSPAILHAILHVEIDSLDGVFWTLYVEFAFYVAFALLYFRLGWRAAVAGLVALAAGWRLADVLLPMTGAPRFVLRALEPPSWVGVPLFGWFASGTLFYKAADLGSRRLLLSAIATGLLAVALFDLPAGITPHIRFLLAGVVLAFAAIQAAPPLQRLLTVRPLLFAGFISYPLYLLHNGLGIGLIGRFAALRPGTEPVALMLAAAAAVGLIAWLIAAFAEPWLRGRLRPVMDRVRRRLRVRPS